jgi:glycosyltransferase involved in cell wall biosynthesis
MLNEKPIVLFVGTYPPRECGIATFTQDLSKAFEKEYSNKFCSKILAMNNNGTNIYNYPKEVIYQISDSDIAEYIEVAKKINRNKSIKLVSIQHEFGIFKGEYGSYLISFLELLNKPVIVTFHSVLPDPNEMLKKVVQSIGQKSDAIIVMAKTGKKILREEYELKCDIRVIPHGIPEIKFTDGEEKKKALGLQNKTILSSFGMINSGKGYEYVIRALPEVVKKFPETLYLIIGETHPVVRREQGESYRNKLEKCVKKLELNKNVKFYNKYVTLEEITHYLEASDIYISSGLNPNQITSGTLVYAMGAGRPIISTPFLHAKEDVNAKRGILVKFEDKKSYEKALLELLSNKKKMKKMGKNSYEYSRKMLWNSVVKKYHSVFSAKLKSKKENYVLPKINLSHLKKMTDSFGMLQFSNGIIPDKDSGYMVDDNARALLLCSKYYKLANEKNEIIELMNIYLNFIEKMQLENGKILNYADSKKEIDAKSFSEDAFGRAIWAVSSIASNNHLPIKMRKQAEKILVKAFPEMKKLKFARSISFALLGITNYSKKKTSAENIKVINLFAEKLLEYYNENSSKEWKWFEKALTYCNGRIPEALFSAYLITGNKRYSEIAEESLDFLINVTFEKDYFAPVGQEGWFFMDGKKAHFDQQPIDASAMVDVLISAHQATSKEKYLKKAFVAFKWFLGKNQINCVVYDKKTGGCRDGIGHSVPNYNEGAESTIAYLLSRVSIESVLGKRAEEYMN